MHSWLIEEVIGFLVLSASHHENTRLHVLLEMPYYASLAGQPLNILVESLGKLPCASGDNSVLHFLWTKLLARTRAF